MVSMQKTKSSNGKFRRILLILCIGSLVIAVFVVPQQENLNLNYLLQQESQLVVNDDSLQGKSVTRGQQNLTKDSATTKSNPVQSPQAIADDANTTKTDKPGQTPEAIKKEENESTDKAEEHKIAGLNCERYGGPSEEISAEMVYWRDIPEDSNFTSPFANDGPEPKYLTFEPDGAGFNNVRMNLETVVVFAHAMGRILVLPPARPMHFLWNDENKKKNALTFHDFFHFETLSKEHAGINIMSMEEFMKREGVSGHLKDQIGNVSYPPPGLISLQYEGARKGNQQKISDYRDKREKVLWEYLRSVAATPIWPFSSCIAVIPKVPGPDAASITKSYIAEIQNLKFDRKKHRGNPTEVDAPLMDRMKEMLGGRKSLCVYDEFWQAKPVLHFMSDYQSGARLLAHFYSFVFFEDWKQGLWIKRFIRDHLRYIDEIQCAAARIVRAVRAKARENGNAQGVFDSFHIRRGDFGQQYKVTQIDADQIYKNIQDVFVENSTVFVATDEKNMTFFNPLREHYNLYFMNDFSELITGLNKNYYGMVDQLVAARGRTFAGPYFSTFTGYINRVRGYHSQKEKLPGYEKGDLQSYFYVTKGRKHDMKKYEAIYRPVWAREFPLGWRDIDHDLEELQSV